MKESAGALAGLLSRIAAAFVRNGPVSDVLAASPDLTRQTLTGEVIVNPIIVGIVPDDLASATMWTVPDRLHRPAIYELDMADVEMQTLTHDDSGRSATRVKPHQRRYALLLGYR